MPQEGELQHYCTSLYLRLKRIVSFKIFTSFHQLTYYKTEIKGEGKTIDLILKSDGNKFELVCGHYILLFQNGELLVLEFLVYIFIVKTI